MITIFTHIPKTSGTSFFTNLITANVPKEEIYQVRGLWRLFSEGLPKEKSVIVGHQPYGLHQFLPGQDVRYITWLREPVDRAVSFYYFVKNGDGIKYRHPLRECAESLSLADFCRLRQIQNMQTRYLAGIIYDRLYDVMPEILRRNLVLQPALKNLKEQYRVFGLLERLEESYSWFQKELDWPHRIDKGINPVKVAQNRPAVSELDSRILEAIQGANELDIELYANALRIFEARKGNESRK